MISTFMINDSFCVAPWFMVRNDNNGTFKPCAVAKYNPEFNIRKHTIEDWRNSEFMTNLREELSCGRSDTCEVCWKAEDSGIKSQRQIINDLIFKGRDEVPWLNAYFKHHNDFKTHLTVISDIKVGTQCNLQCAMCHPWDSTKIYAEWQKRPNKEFTVQDPKYYEEIRKTYKDDKPSLYLDELLQHPLTFLKILGGEPLLDKRIQEKLLGLPLHRKKHIRLCFVTNGTIDMVEYAKKYHEFKEVFFSVSLDGFGGINDYIRRHSKWKEIFENLLAVHESNVATVSIITSIQALNILSIQSLFDMADYFGIQVEIGWVIEPDFLSLNSMPPEILEIARERTNCEPVLAAINNAVYNPKLYEKFLRYIEWYEADFQSHCKLSHIQPEFYSKKSPNNYVGLF